MGLLAVLVGSFGYSGFFPFAPATFASLVFVLIYLFVPGGKILVHPLAFALTLVLSVPISSSMEKRYGRDASCIVIDEVVGMQVILMGADPSRLGALVAFFVFRFFDVAKPYPVARSQSLPGGYGVVGDDLLAGLYSRLVLLGLSLVFASLGGFSFGRL